MFILQNLIYFIISIICTVQKKYSYSVVEIKNNCTVIWIFRKHLNLKFKFLILGKFQQPFLWRFSYFKYEFRSGKNILFSALLSCFSSIFYFVGVTGPSVKENLRQIIVQNNLFFHSCCKHIHIYAFSKIKKKNP